MKLINAKLLSTAVIPLAAAAGLAIGGGIMTAAPSHARVVSQDVAAELPQAKARADGLRLASCSPCKAKSPCAPCGAKSPCAPCGAKSPCGATNPCGAKKK